MYCSFKREFQVKKTVQKSHIHFHQRIGLFDQNIKSFDQISRSNVMIALIAFKIGITICTVNQKKDSIDIKRENMEHILSTFDNNIT
ncbi:hypothetical protein CDL62_03765 [Alkalitalea saponilacus]|nr:hypothetical protein CDL62_03765 [Alkalitalea saponilacus]